MKAVTFFIFSDRFNRNRRKEILGLDLPRNADVQHR